MKATHILVANIFFAPFSYGGATIVAEQVAKALHTMGGFRITAVSLCARADLAAYTVVKSQRDGISNYLINVPPHRTYGQMYDNPEVTARLAELISTLEPDLVHAHCIQEMGTGIITAAEAADVPTILSVHDFWWICERQFMVGIDGRYCGQNPVRTDACKGCADNIWAAQTRASHLKEVAARAAVVTYPSAFAKSLNEASGLAPGKGVVWENGVRLPIPAFFDKQAQRRRADGRLTFGYIGGPSPIKGWPQIKAAFESVKRQDFRGLVVEGSLDGSWWREDDLARLSGDWSIHPRFAQKDMDTFYAQIDVLLFMSQWKETYGLAIREALARGISVIQTDSGGTVEHGAIPAEDLIPIGAPPDILRRKVEDLLSAPLPRVDPWPVTGVEDQARSFASLACRVLENVNRAA